LLASCLVVRGDLYRLCDRYDDAESLYRRGLRLGRRFLALGTEAAARVGLGQVEVARGNTERARGQLQRALQIYSACRQVVAAHSVRLIGAALTDQDVEERYAGLERLVTHGYRFECIAADIAATSLLGAQLLEMEQPERAVRYFCDAGTDAEENGLQHSELVANGARALIEADVGQQDAALDLMEETLKRMDALGLQSSLRRQLAERYRDLTGWTWN
jgi:tetratricopeptide (TPR) repeat protein